MSLNREKLDETLIIMFTDINYVSSYLFYAHMIAQCDIKLIEMDAPAAVSFDKTRYVLYINPESFYQYSLLERLAILKHEMLHILYKHIERRIDRDNKIWNYATDCAINQQIDSKHLPIGCITPLTLSEKMNCNIPHNLSAEEYYELLLNNKEKLENTENFSDFDSHEEWNNEVFDDNYKNEITKKMIEKADTETRKNGCESPNFLSKILNLFNKKKEVNWKKILKSKIGNLLADKIKTIKKRDRRQPHRMDLCGTKKNKLSNVLGIVDISGSMDNDSIYILLSEIQHICKITNTPFNLIQVDTVARDPEKFCKNTKIFTRKGSGGTYLSRALDKAKEHKLNESIIVVISDGELADSDIDKFIKENKTIIWLLKKGADVTKLNVGKMKAIEIKNN